MRNLGRYVFICFLFTLLSGLGGWWHSTDGTAECRSVVQGLSSASDTGEYYDLYRYTYVGLPVSGVIADNNTTNAPSLKCPFNHNEQYGAWAKNSHNSYSRLTCGRHGPSVHLSGSRSVDYYIFRLQRILI